MPPLDDAPADDISSILDREYLTPSPSAAVRAAAADMNPAQASAALTQARKNNIPPSLLVDGPDPDIERRNRLAAQAEKLRTSQMLDQWLASQPPLVAASVSDDLPALTGVERAMQFASNSGRALLAGVPAISEGIYGLVEAGGAALPDIIGDPIENAASYARKEVAAYKESLTPKTDSAVMSGYYSGLTSLTQMAFTLPAAIMTGNPALALYPMAGITAGQSYGQARDKGVDPARAALFGLEQGAVEYITEKIPAGKLVEDLAKSTGFGKLLLGQALTEIPGEQVATVMQDFNEWVTLNPEKPFGDFMRERPDAALSTLVASVVGSGVMSSAAYGANRLAMRARQDDQKLAEAQQAAQVLSDLSVAAQASVVRQRDVETFEGFLQSVTAGTPLEAVYIDAQTLQESGLAAQLAQASPTVADQLQQMQAGTMVRIPTEEVMGRFHEQLAPLLQDLRADPNGMTQREAEEFMQTRGEQLQADVEQILGGAAADAQSAQEREQIKQDIASQLVATGLSTPAQADAYAALTASFYSVMAVRMRTTPGELYRQHQLRVLGDGSVGELSQSAEQNSAVLLGSANIAMDLARKNYSRDTYPELAEAEDKAEAQFLDTLRQSNPDMFDEEGQLTDDAFEQVYNGGMLDDAMREVRTAFERDMFPALTSMKDVQYLSPDLRAAVMSAVQKDIVAQQLPNVIQIADSIGLQFKSEYRQYATFVDGEGNTVEVRLFKDHAQKVGGGYSMATGDRMGNSDVDVFFDESGSIYVEAISDDEQAKALAEKLAQAYEGKDIFAGLDQDGELYQRKAKGGNVTLIDEGRIADADYRVMRREFDGLNADEQAVFDDFIATHPNGDELLARLKEHKGTPWAMQATEGVFVRQAIKLYAAGQKPAFQSMFDHKHATKVRELVKARGIEGVHLYLDASGFVGDASKPINNVSSTFINCNPSLDCAKYCYATEGHYRYAPSVVKSELVSLAIEMDPVRSAKRTAAEYKATAEFANKKALRLFDKGDGGEAWLPYIEALNKEGVRLHIFSKLPEFLRKVPEMNLRLLSIDQSNMAMADENPDLPVAFVYSGPDQIDFLAKLTARGQIQVVLPVKLGRNVFTNKQTRELKKAVDKIGKYICPIDGGVKKIGPNSDEQGWNCTKCDKGGGLGCYFGKVTEAVLNSAEAKPVGPRERAARILELRKLINEFTRGSEGTAGASEGVADTGRAQQGGVSELLSEVDSLLGELLRDYEPDAETANALGGDAGAPAQDRGVQGNQRGAALRRIPVKVEQGGGGEFLQSAYHGTHARGIERFSTDYIGTGEGAQAYGWGLYFASKREIAEYYRRTVSPPPSSSFWGNESVSEVLRRELGLSASEADALYDAYRVVIGKVDTKQTPEQLLEARSASLRQRTNKAEREALIEQAKRLLSPRMGQLYEVDIPEDNELLLWDKPLNEQPENIRTALMSTTSASTTLENLLAPKDVKGLLKWAKTHDKNSSWDELLDENPDTTADELRRYLLDAYDDEDMQSYLAEDAVDPTRTGESIYRQMATKLGSDKAASEALAALGIKGIKYLDGTSRSAGDGSYNYVIFSGDDVAITNQFYQNSGEPRGSFSPSQLVIRLTKARDLSTYLHESGHFFLHMLTTLAARPDSPQDIRDDADAALKWMGIEQTPEMSRLDAWLGMSVDEQRTAHEKLARGFEVYLSEGKAPSVELQPLFAKFRSWLLNVYRYLKQAMSKGLDAQLNDEVRAVFDRMLATEDEIHNAEAARSMGMLFSTEQEAAQFGVDWAGYQNQAQAATDEAVASLDAKTVKNMRWLSNAKSKLLRKMQREANAVRREVRAGVRTEIMSQPVYQAYEFLSRRVSKADRDAAKRRPPEESTAGPLDPRIDSLFVAIAKYGGLNFESARSEWGLDKATKIPNPIAGKPVLVKKGGKTVDYMLEALSQDGYLPLDPVDGRAWLTDLEDRFFRELGGEPQYSYQADIMAMMPDTGLDAPIEDMLGGRLSDEDLTAMVAAGDLSGPVARALADKGLTASTGLNPELVAARFGFSSADEMLQALAQSQSPREAIEALTDQRMVEQYSELATDKGREAAVNAALAGEARARMVETELSALEAANNTRTPTQGRDGKTRRQNTLPAAARQFARQVVDRMRIRDVRPSQFSGSASRAARASAKALKVGNVAEAAMEKRNELVNMLASKRAREALESVQTGLAYLKKFQNEGTRKNLDPEYLDQIDQILERYDLRKSTIKGLDKRQALKDWLAEQEAAGLTPDLPPHIEEERQRSPYQELTVEEFDGLVDSIKQIEHFGRLKKKLLLAKDKREFNAIVQQIQTSIEANAKGKPKDNRTPTDLLGRLAAKWEGFTAAHRKVASLVYQMDGFRDGGPLWDALVRTANEQGNWEATKQAELTERLGRLLKGISFGSRFSRGKYFTGIKMSLTREQQLAVALNWGNEGNRQRLMDGRQWSVGAVQEVLDNLSQRDWDFVQGVWDTFESLRPAIAEKERKVMGKEPAWVEPVPVTTKFGTLRGGYYPAVYDPRENLKAEENESAEAVKRQLQGARSAATTRRNFVKARAEEVKGRPLLLTMDGMFRGLTDVVHDLAWHEWLIDANRLLRALDPVIRDRYGAEVVQQLRSAKDAIAAGEAGVPHALDGPVRHIRIGATVAGLGFNLVNAALQPLGLTQSVVRVGARWIAQGAGRLAANPRALARDVMGKSEFMRNRARTQNRELNDLRNSIRGKSDARQRFDALLFWPMTQMQLVVDLPTWWGAYQKALRDGADEDTAVQRADQAVIDSQGGGQIKDLAAIQRGPEAVKLFTTFYGYFSTAYNLGVERYRATDKTSPLQMLQLAGDYLLLYSVPAVLGLAIKEALSGGGDDDDEELAKKLAREQVSYLMGLMVGVREMTGAAQMLAGLQTKGAGYGGPAGLRFLQELQKLAQQVNQGEIDRAFVRATVNVAGIGLHLPSAQINRTLDGINAMQEGETRNPTVLVGGSR